jgi:hypothetical protein
MALPLPRANPLDRLGLARMDILAAFCTAKADTIEL